MKAEIFSTGDEIRTGSIIDTNSAYIADKLMGIGAIVTRHTNIGDDLDELVNGFIEASKRVDVVIVTGGLGPTDDDLTAEAASKACNVSLKLNEKALESVDSYFKSRKWQTTKENVKQAFLPECAECLENIVGTAPGFSMNIGKCRFWFMPGVPLEMKHMMKVKVLPGVLELMGEDKGFNITKTMSLFGLPEAEVGKKLHGIAKNIPDVEVGLRADFPVIHVKLYGSGSDKIRLEQSIFKVEEDVKKLLAEWLFSVDGSSMQAVVGKLLAEQNKTIAIAESCTGGLISNWLTDVAGSSDYFLFSGITYSNESKIKVLGVSKKIIELNGAVSVETAKEMAKGVRNVAGADYGISTSGVAGPGGGTDDKPVGTVCIGISGPKGDTSRRFDFTHTDRALNKKLFAMTALELIRRELIRE